MFEQLPDIIVKDACFSLTCDAQSIYSLTTTTGQHKGTTLPPPARPFPTSYLEDFENYAVAQRPVISRTKQLASKWPLAPTAKARRCGKSC